MTRRVRGVAGLDRDGLRFVTEKPTRPVSLVAPLPKRKLGIDYDTAWTRRYPVRLARAVVLDDIARPVARRGALTPSDRARTSRSCSGSDDSRCKPREPPRHRPVAVEPAGPVTPPHRRCRGGRLLLRPALESRLLVLRPRSHPDGALQAQSPFRGSGLEPHQRRMEPHHLPRRRPY